MSPSTSALAARGPVARALTLVLATSSIAGAPACRETTLGPGPAPCTHFEAGLITAPDPPDLSELHLVVLLGDPSLRDELDARLPETSALLQSGRLVRGGPQEYRPLDSVEATVLAVDLADVRAVESGVVETVAAMVNAPPRIDVLAVGDCERASLTGLAEELRRRTLASFASTSCEDGVDAALESLLTEIATQRCPMGCLAERRLRAHDGLIDCALFEVLPAGASHDECDRLPGRSREDVLHIDDEERVRCRVEQLTDGAGVQGDRAGWYYDDTSGTTERLCGPDAARFSVTPPGAPLVGSQLRFECLYRATAPPRATLCTNDHFGTSQPCLAGMRCVPEDARDLCEERRAPGTAPMRCDAASLRCAYSCESDDDCERAGLAGHVCDLRANAEAAGSLADRVDEPRRDEPRRVCVSPTCE